MGLAMLHAPAGAGGTFTSGGSESIFLALLAAREKAGLPGGNVVLPDTAHLTFDRACWYLGLEARRIPWGRPRGRRAGDGGGDGCAHRGAGRLGALLPLRRHRPDRGAGRAGRGARHWLHVDACVGGFLSPFLERLGVALPEWDFRAPAFPRSAPTSTSTAWRRREPRCCWCATRRCSGFHRFESRAWARGLYAAQTAQGTRPGGAVAGAWAVMRHLGIAGYEDCARRILAARAEIMAGIAAIPGLEALEGRHAILVYRSIAPDLPITAVAAGLEAQGWLVSRQQDPDGIHLHLNPLHAEVAGEYVAALREAALAARGKANAAPEEVRAY
jgi:glutamate/tyrosine decarboxylase-like PLP-dependent enzyme